MPSRDRLVAHLRSRLLRRGYPRLQMTLLVALTCGVGFIASSLLLRAGLEGMALRYAIAVVIAYVGFLTLLWAWVRTRTRDLGDAVDLPELRGGSHGSTDWSGHGGEFGGGGASGSFDAPSSLPEVPDAVSGALDGADEAALPIVALLIVVAIACSSLWLVYTAPTLMAELAIDVALGAGLYRRLRRVDATSWLQTAVRRTGWPFVLTLVGVAAAALIAQHVVPGVQSIGDVLLAARPFPAH